MSITYTGSASGIASNPTIAITEPTDGDARNAASVNVALSKLADYLQKISGDYVPLIQFSAPSTSYTFTINAANWTTSFNKSYKDPTGRIWVSMTLIATATPSGTVCTITGAGFQPTHTTPFSAIRVPAGGGGVFSGVAILGLIDTSGLVALNPTPIANNDVVYLNFSYSTTL